MGRSPFVDADDGMVKIRRSPVWLGVVALVLVVACEQDVDVAGSTSPPSTSPPSTSPPSIQLEDCEVGGLPARCGSFPVYEDRVAMSGRVIDLNLVVVPATEGDAEPDPIFFLSGGPRGAATEDGIVSFDLLREAMRTRDLVLVDQRGTGGSNAITCEMTSGEDELELLRACLSESPADVAAYTTAWAVDDLDEVRAALGYESVNLYGASYGVTVAQVYAQRHPARVRSALLEAGTSVEVPMFERLPSASQRAFDKVVDRCAASTRCREAFPDPASDLDILLARLDQEPVELEYTDGETLEVSREEMSVILHVLLTNTKAAGMVPWALATAAAGDWKSVSDRIEPYLYDPDLGDPAWLAMNLTILCHEPWARLDEAETDEWAGDSYLTYEEVRMLLVPERICGVVPPPDPAAIYEPSTEVSVPILAISMEADAQNPPENMADLDEHYPNSRVVVLPGQSHQQITPSASTCVAGMLTSFFDTASIEGIPTDCIDAVRPDLFYLPSS